MCLSALVLFWLISGTSSVCRCPAQNWNWLNELEEINACACKIKMQKTISEQILERFNTQVQRREFCRFQPCHISPSCQNTRVTAAYFTRRENVTEVATFPQLYNGSDIIVDFPFGS